MAFKDFVSADMDNVFLNQEEFAEIVYIDNVPIRAVLTQNKAVFEQGTSSFVDLLSCKTVDLPFEVHNGDVLDINGVMQVVADVQETMGITDITLRRNG